MDAEAAEVADALMYGSIEASNRRVVRRALKLIGRSV